MKINEIKGKWKSHLSGFLRGGLVALLVMIQFSVLIGLSFWLRSFTVYFYVILEVLSFLVVITLMNDNRCPSYKIAWICIVLLFPISGHIMFALWGKSTANKSLTNNIRAKIERGKSFLDFNDSILQEIREDYKEIERVSNYMVSEGFPMFKNNDIPIIPWGKIRLMLCLMIFAMRRSLF